MQRLMSKTQHMMAKMEEKIGVIGTFLHYFELNMMNNDDEINQLIISHFLFEILEMEIDNKEDFETLMIYAKRYNVDVSNIENER